MKISLKRRINRKNLLRKSLRRTKRTQTGGADSSYYAFFCNYSDARSKGILCEQTDTAPSFDKIQNKLSLNAYRYKIFGPVDAGFDNETETQGTHLRLVARREDLNTDKHIPRTISIDSSLIPDITLSENTIHTVRNVAKIKKLCESLLLRYFYMQEYGSIFKPMLINYCIIIEQNKRPTFFNKGKEDNKILDCIYGPSLNGREWSHPTDLIPADSSFWDDMR